MARKVTINKGNYSLDTPERESLFNKKRAFGVEMDFYRSRQEWEAFPKNAYISDYPILVDIELSSFCNLKCPFCYTISDRYKRKINAKLMDFKLFKKVVDEIGRRVFSIRLSLRGEPTLHPNFIEAIEYAKKSGIREVSTLTNGSKLTLELFTKAMAAGLDWITVSFDGLYGTYEKNRYPLKFDAIYKRLKKIKEFKEKNGKIKPVVKIQSVWPAIAENPSEFYDKMSVVSDLVAFNPIIDFNRTTGNEEIEYEKDFSCPQIYQRLVIGADGRAMMCSNDEESEHVIGDAYKESIYDIWHCEKLNEARKLLQEKGGFKKIGICKKCYLPRKTKDDIAEVNGRKVIVKNYVSGGAAC
jgi:radical SAM protein with 4Fe4S-binding SPASM domain